MVLLQYFCFSLKVPQEVKTKNKKVKDFDIVKTFREIKEKISAEIQGMNFEQLTAYLAKTKQQAPK